jgi:hypothetical protein
LQSSGRRHDRMLSLDSRARPSRRGRHSLPFASGPEATHRRFGEVGQSDQKAQGVVRFGNSILCRRQELIEEADLRLEQLGEQLESRYRPIEDVHTDLLNCCIINGLVGGPARIRT